MVNSGSEYQSVSQCSIVCQTLDACVGKYADLTLNQGGSGLRLSLLSHHLAPVQI